MKRAVSIAAGLLLAACATSPSISDRYQGIDPVAVSTRDTYRVYDKRSENLVLVTGRGGTGYWPGYAPAPMIGDTRLLPRQIYQEAAERYFANAGHSECRVVDGYQLARTAFEFQYVCGSPATN